MPSTVASPLYTLVDRSAVSSGDNSSKWNYKGKYLTGVVSDWITEKEALDSFTPLQLDGFHALWELYHDASGDASRPRPVVSPRVERNVADRERALREIPIGREVWRKIADHEGNSRW